jgi:hypothetical protein
VRNICVLQGAWLTIAQWAAVEVRLQRDLARQIIRRHQSAIKWEGYLHEFQPELSPEERRRALKAGEGHVARWIEQAIDLCATGAE